MNNIAVENKAVIINKPVRSSRIKREIGSIVGIFAREVTLMIKSPAVLAISFVMPIIMMGMVGGNMMENMTSGIGFDFGVFMLVGMMVNMLFMMTSQGVASLVDDGDGNFSAEMLVSPVSRYSIVIGKILGSSVNAIISMFGAVIVGLIMGISLSWQQILLIIALSPLICLAAGAFSIIFVGAIKNKKAANSVVMAIAMAQMFLAGAIIPIASSTGVLWFLARIMPMTYCLDLVRAVVFAGTPEYSVVMFDPFVNILAIIGLTIVCLAIGTFLFARSEKDR